MNVYISAKEAARIAAIYTNQPYLLTLTRETGMEPLHYHGLLLRYRSKRWSLNGLATRINKTQIKELLHINFKQLSQREARANPGRR